MLIVEKIGGLLVVDLENRVVGIIFEIDIFKKEKYIEVFFYINLL